MRDLKELGRKIPCLVTSDQCLLNFKANPKPPSHSNRKWVCKAEQLQTGDSCPVFLSQIALGTMDKENYTVHQTPGQPKLRSKNSL